MADWGWEAFAETHGHDIVSVFPRHARLRSFWEIQGHHIARVCPQHARLGNA